MSDATAAARTAPGKHKRRLSNFLLDKKLQLRYVLLVTVLSGVIAGALGYLIYQQKRAASLSIEQELSVLTSTDDSQAEFQAQLSGRLASADRAWVDKMVIVGLGLVLVLSLYLLVMTHKVAGPLYKVSLYFERMAAGRLGPVTRLRQGDMLQDFYTSFQEMHDTVRARAQRDAAALERAVAALRAASEASTAGAAERASLGDALDALDRHVQARAKNLA